MCFKEDLMFDESPIMSDAEFIPNLRTTSKASCEHY